jgi:hypothetical protein
MKSKFLKRLAPQNMFSLKDFRLTSLLDESKNRNTIYDDHENFFFEKLPWQFVKHRKYFDKNHRGFGENAFHSMWYFLFSEFKPKKCLEIGVYRGQTITLWALLCKYFGFDCHIAAVSPFSADGDAVSNYLKDIDYLSDTQLNHEYFKLPQPQYCVGLSTSIQAHEFVGQTKWDLIYIDGSHDIDVVRQDLELAINNLSSNGIIVMDDSSLYFDYVPRSNSFAGHPGPSQVALEYPQNHLRLLGGVGHNNIFIKIDTFN